MSRLNGWLRIRILERDHFTCVYCGRKPPEVALEVDHVLARVRGGSDDATNLVTACRECNNGKRAGLISLPDTVVLAPLPSKLQERIRHVARLEQEHAARSTLRERIWPVGGQGNRRGWPMPDGAWDQMCVKPHTEGYLPWGVWQVKSDWYVGFYSCDEGHAWTCGHSGTAGWSEIREFRVSPFSDLPPSGYLRYHLGSTFDPRLVQRITYPRVSA